MSQGVSVESSTQPFQTPSINPVLQAALSSLDVQIEAELFRYRRQRAGRPVPPVRTLGGHQTRKSIELISVGATASSTPLSASRMSGAAAISHSQSAQVNQTLSAAYGSESSSSQMTLAKSAAPEADNPAVGNSSSGQNYPQTGGSEGLGLADAYAHNFQPDDYLASSEQLLRSLAEEDTDGETERRFLDSVLTPLGIGSMLLLLLTSATIGYVVVNPSVRAGLGIDKFGKPPDPTIAQNPTSGLSSTGAESQGAQAPNRSSQESPIVNGPNLANQEFVELNLNTLSSLKTNPSPSLALVPNQQALPPLAVAPPTKGQNGVATSEHPSDLASAILPPSVSSAVISPRIPAVMPIPGDSTTRGTPSTRQRQTSRAESLAQPERDRYYVLTNYQNDHSLEQAHRVVADAYVRNFPDGARIQVATFPKESQAKKLVQQLQKQGIYAWVYHPHP